MPGARSDEQAVSTLRCGCEPGPPPTPEYERRNDARASPGPWEGHVQCQGRARQVGLRMFASGFGEHLSQSQRGVCVQGACCPAQVCGGDRDQGRQTCPLSLRPPAPWEGRTTRREVRTLVPTAKDLASASSLGTLRAATGSVWDSHAYMRSGQNSVHS